MNDSSVFEALKESNQVIKETGQGCNIDAFEDVKEQIEINKENQELVSDFFADQINEGKDELEKELEELLALEGIEEQLESEVAKV